MRAAAAIAAACALAALLPVAASGIEDQRQSDAASAALGTPEQRRPGDTSEAAGHPTTLRSL